MAGGVANTASSTAFANDESPEELLALHEALEDFALHDPLKAKLVELRFFGGLTLEQAAATLKISLSSAERAWRYARAWLYTALADSRSRKSPKRKSRLKGSGTPASHEGVTDTADDHRKGLRRP